MGVGRGIEGGALFAEKECFFRENIFECLLCSFTCNSGSQKRTKIMHPNSLCKNESEHGEQMALFCWAAYQKQLDSRLGLLFAVHNQGHGDAIRGARAKAEGVKAGVPDLFLPVPGQGGPGLWIEMKKRKGGTVSAEQKEWMGKLRAQGYACMVAKGWREAAKALQLWLEFEELPWPDGQPYR